MIKATAHTPDGPVLLIGLSGENVARLYADEPIVVAAEELGLPHLQIVIVAGRTDDDITAAIRRHVPIRYSRPGQNLT